MGIDLSSLIKVYPYGFLKITRENPNHNVVNHVMFEKCYHQFPIKLKAFCVCIPCIHCIYCLIIDSAYIKNFSSFFFFAIFLFLAYKQGNPFDDWVDIIFSKKNYHSRRFSFNIVWVETDVTPFFLTCNPSIFFLPFISFISLGNPFRLVWMVPIQVICLLYSHLAKGIEV